MLNDDHVQLCVKVKEDLFDPVKMKEICWNRLQNSKNINVKLNSEATSDVFSQYDFVKCKRSR